MAYNNQIILEGNLTADCEEIQDKGVKFNLAVNDGKNADGTNKTMFVGCVLWTNNPDNLDKCFEGLTKGLRVRVTGRIDLSKYETQEGFKQNIIKVIADKVEEITITYSALRKKPTEDESDKRTRKKPTEDITLQDYDSDDCPF